MGKAFWAETLKYRHNKLVWLTLVASFIIPLLDMSLYAARKGFTWDAFLTITTHNTGEIYGYILRVIITVYVFGREFVHGNIDNLFTTPVKRYYVVFAKLFFVFSWSTVLTITEWGAALVIGWMVGLGLPSISVACICLYRLSVVNLLIFLTLPTIAVIVLLWRNYILPMTSILTIYLLNQAFETVRGVWYRSLPWQLPSFYIHHIIGDYGPVSPYSIGISLFIFCISLIFAIFYVYHTDYDEKY